MTEQNRCFNATEAMDNLSHNGKLGLLGMQEHVGMLGGNMEIVSKPGEGATLLFKIPAKK